MTSRSSRRDFLKTTALAISALAMPVASAYSDEKKHALCSRIEEIVKKHAYDKDVDAALVELNEMLINDFEKPGIFWKTAVSAELKPGDAAEYQIAVQPTPAHKIKVFTCTVKPE